MPVFLCAVWSAWLIGNPTTPCCTSRTAPFASPFASRWAMPSFLGSPWRKGAASLLVREDGASTPGSKVRCADLEDGPTSISRPTVPTGSWCSSFMFPSQRCPDLGSPWNSMSQILLNGTRAGKIPMPPATLNDIASNRGHWEITRNTKSRIWMTCLDSCHSTHKSTDPAHGPWQSHASANRPRLPSHELKCFLPVKMGSQTSHLVQNRQMLQSQAFCICSMWHVPNLRILKGLLLQSLMSCRLRFQCLPSGKQT